LSTKQKKILVCGAGGFIGHHLVTALKKRGSWVVASGRGKPCFEDSLADDFVVGDLTDLAFCEFLFNKHNCVFDEVYQLAAEMGGAGYIERAEADIMHRSTLMNLHLIDQSVKHKAKKFFYSSSVCVYRDMELGEKELSEENAYPALPNNEYGWEKLYSERLVSTYARYYPIQVRIGRFQNCYGPLGAWKGGKEKAVAAICRKVAQARENSSVQVWGDGSAVRSYLYIDDLIDAVLRLMNSNMQLPTNIGSPQYLSVDELVSEIISVSGKNLRIEHIDGPTGVLSRNFSNQRIYSTGWKPKVSLRDGLSITYNWIRKQVEHE
jgi:GDP-D-mannose 3',5'-epimerase